MIMHNKIRELPTPLLALNIENGLGSWGADSSNMKVIVRFTVLGKPQFWAHAV